MMKKILKLLSSKDEFLFSVGLRLNKRNYVVTSGRPRRFGWCDLNVLMRALEINGGNICITKLDFLENLPYIKLCLSNKKFKSEKINFKKISTIPKRYSKFFKRN